MSRWTPTMLNPAAAQSLAHRGTEPAAGPSTIAQRSRPSCCCVMVPRGRSTGAGRRPCRECTDACPMPLSGVNHRLPRTATRRSLPWQRLAYHRVGGGVRAVPGPRRGRRRGGHRGASHPRAVAGVAGGRRPGADAGAAFSHVEHRRPSWCSPCSCRRSCSGRPGSAGPGLQALPPADPVALSASSCSPPPSSHSWAARSSLASRSLPRSPWEPSWHRRTPSRPSRAAPLAVPRRLVAILEGESLVNDATALTAYGVSVGGRDQRRSCSASAVGDFVWVVAVGSSWVSWSQSCVAGSGHACSTRRSRSPCRWSSRISRTCPLSSSTARGSSRR